MQSVWRNRHAEPYTLRMQSSTVPRKVQRGHDKVLKEIAKAVEDRRKLVNVSPWKKRKWIKFVKQGECKKQATKPEREDSSYLITARDETQSLSLKETCCTTTHSRDNSQTRYAVDIGEIKATRNN